MFKLRAFLAMSICIAAYAASATTYYVDYDAGSDENDGLSMSTAFKTVKHALDLGSDVLKDGEIVLKSGTHHLNGAPLVKNVYCTIRSETRNPADVTIDADGLSECARFVGSNGVKPKIPMRVIGITFRNGAKPTGNSSVACCLNIDGNVIASNCVITANIEAGETTLGYPPVYVKDALLVDCVVSNNAVRGNCSAVQLAADGRCRGCLLTDNRTTSNVGGPIYAPFGGEIIDTVVSNNVSLINAGVYGAPNLISGCTFVTNKISITQLRDTGVLTICNLKESRPGITVVTNCTIAGNYCESSSNPTCAGVRINGQSCLMVGCVVSNNVSRGNTGMDAQVTDGTAVTIAGCTFAGNAATTTSGGGAYLGTGVTVTNCAFIGNTANQAGGGVHGGASRWSIARSQTMLRMSVAAHASARMTTASPRSRARFSWTTRRMSRAAGFRWASSTRLLPTRTGMQPSQDAPFCKTGR